MANHLGKQSSPSDDTRIEVLYDHYKDSFMQSAEHRKQRDRFLVFILIVVSLQLFQVFSPTSAEATIGEFVAKKLELASPVDVSFVKSIIWFALLGLTTRYFQSCIALERQYIYIHKIEETLCQVFQGEVFTREGKAYLNSYPLFSDWTHFIYSWAFPLILISTIAVKIYNEILASTGFSILLVLNATFAFFIVISSVLYLIAMHPIKARENTVKKRHETKFSQKQNI